MVQGLGKHQREQRLKTESKIAAFLNLQEFGFNELQELTGTRRDSLRVVIDSLVDRNIVNKHVIKNNTSVQIQPQVNKVRRGTYYKLNSDNQEAKHLIDIYYNDRPPKLPIKVKQELLSLVKTFHKTMLKEHDVIAQQVETFKKHIEPLLVTHEPDKTLGVWFDSLGLYRHYLQLMNKNMKIFAIKARLRLDWVDRSKS
jgi:hypothetical protein